MRHYKPSSACGRGGGSMVESWEMNLNSKKMKPNSSEDFVELTLTLEL
jgi:hypothetical protein